MVHIFVGMSFVLGMVAIIACFSYIPFFCGLTQVGFWGNTGLFVQFFLTVTSFIACVWSIMSDADGHHFFFYPFALFVVSLIGQWIVGIAGCIDTLPGDTVGFIGCMWVVLCTLLQLLLLCANQILQKKNRLIEEADETDSFYKFGSN